MSRVLKVYNSNYKIAVTSGGEITLDTSNGVIDGSGNPIGTVVVKGNLEVQGTTTTIESREVTIEDNIIVLSSGTIGSGLPSSVGYKSGIEIDRGTAAHASWLYYEQISWQLGGTASAGTFYATRDGQTLPLATSGLVLNGADKLYVTTPETVISVTNSGDYEEHIWNYAGAPAIITPNAFGEIIVDDDHIPNTRAVVDYIDYSFANTTYSSIALSDTSVVIVDQIHTIANILAVGTTTTIQTVGQHGFSITDTVDIIGVVGGGDDIELLNGTNIPITEIVSPTVFKVDVDTSTGNNLTYAGGAIVQINGFNPQADEPRIKIQVSGNVTTNFYDNRFEVHDLKIQGSEISTTASDQDLLLSAAGTGTVKVKDVLELGPSLWDDDENSIAINAPASGVKIYTTLTTDSSAADAQTPGNTGIYFVNSNENRDELIAKNRALLYSMIF